MQLLPNRSDLKAAEYRWMIQSKTPNKILAFYHDASHILSAVGGLKPLILDGVIYGKPPGRAGILSFFPYKAGVREQAMADPNQFYYWERPDFYKKPQGKYVPSHTGRTVATSEEPWHSYTDEQIKNKIYDICVESINTNYSIDDICLAHGLTHWAFITFFQDRYPQEYYEYAKHKKIPKRDQLAQDRYAWVSTMPHVRK